MRVLKSFFLKLDSGQALVETAIVLPFLLTVFLNVFNLGFFFLVAVNVAVAPRAAGEYSIIGFSTPAESDTLPDAIPAGTNSTVAFLGYEDLRGALASYANAKIQICSGRIGITRFGFSDQTAQCKTCTSSSDATCSGTNTYTPTSDLQSPEFLLHRVDITYTFSTLFNGTAFNVILPSGLCTSGTCTFHRSISIRAMD